MRSAAATSPCSSSILERKAAVTSSGVTPHLADRGRCGGYFVIRGIVAFSRDLIYRFVPGRENLIPYAHQCLLIAAFSSTPVPVSEPRC